MLPFLLIGKALKPLAKIKKKAWSAMGSAFGQIRKSVDPMQSFSKILEIVNVLMLPLTYIFTILAMIILKELMPYIGDLIIILGDLEEALHDVGDAASDAIDDLADLIEEMNLWLDQHVPWLNTFIDMINLGLSNMYDAYVGWFEDILEYIEALSSGGSGEKEGSGLGEWFDSLISGGGGGGVIVPASTTYNTGGATNLTIDLRGTIIDDRDKLIRDIMEQVVIRL